MDVHPPHIPPTSPQDVSVVDMTQIPTRGVCQYIMGDQSQGLWGSYSRHPEPQQGQSRDASVVSNIL